MKILNQVDGGGTIGITIGEVWSHRYSWVMVTPIDTFIDQADTLEGLKEISENNGGAKNRTLDTIIDCIHKPDRDGIPGYGEALYIGGFCIAKSDSLTIIEN